MSTSDLEGANHQVGAGVYGGWGAGECPICGYTAVEVFFELRGIPASDGRLWPTKEQARGAMQGDIRLAFCRNCGTISNQAFDPTKVAYGEGYNASLEHSPIYRQFIQDLARDLIDRYSLKHKRIVEIACGSGEFLRLLCRFGQNEGFGFDPSLPSPGVEHFDGGAVTLIRAFYSDDHAQHRGDLVCCRHLLSSVSSPKSLIGLARRALGDRPDALLYVEMPDVRSVLRDAVWNLTYEHCSYFTDISLAWLFAGCGFEVQSSQRCFLDQYVNVVAVPARQPVTVPVHALAGVQALAEDVAAFAARYEAAATLWHARLDDIERTGRRAVAWGAGGRAITFLSALKVESQIKYAVDVNPSKQGTFLAGTGQLIVPPTFLLDYKPDLVIVTNSAFEEEIRQHLKELRLTCDILVA